MKLMIKKSDLLDIPCSEYNNLPDGKFDAIKEIAKRGNYTEHVGWLMANCKLAQTTKMLEYFKSRNPLAGNVCLLMENCRFTRTAKMLEYFKSLKPSAEDVSSLITNCKFAQTTKTLEYFNSLNPSAYNISWLIGHCKFAKKYFDKIGI